jgi:hypothetical protein
MKSKIEWLGKIINNHEKNEANKDEVTGYIHVVHVSIPIESHVPRKSRNEKLIITIYYLSYPLHS